MRKRIATSVLAAALMAVPALAIESPTPPAKTQVQKDRPAVASTKKRTTHRRHRQHRLAPEAAPKPATPQK